MTARPEYTVLTERDDAHHVVIRRDGSEWFHRVATFARLDRAEDYAETENNWLEFDTEDDQWASERYEAPEPEPDIDIPRSAIKPENFKPSDHAGARPHQADPPSRCPGRHSRKLPHPPARSLT